MEYEFIDPKVNAYVDAIKQEIALNWKVRIVVSKYGLSDIVPEVPDQTVSVKVEVEDDQGDYYEERKDFEIKNASVSIDTQDADMSRLGLYVKDVMIDGKDTVVIFGSNAT